MQIQILQNRLEEAQALTESLLESRQISFQELVPSMLDDKPGVYAIFDRTTGKTLYVGRTKNIKRRLYTNHLMGTKANARLKKYLAEDGERKDIPDMEAAKQYLRKNCYFQYILINDRIRRGQVEGLFSYLLDVYYIHEEH